jgi:hypothetical protein
MDWCEHSKRSLLEYDPLGVVFTILRSFIAIYIKSWDSVLSLSELRNAFLNTVNGNQRNHICRSDFIVRKCQVESANSHCAICRTKITEIKRIFL